jgi:hypothetical protein
MLINFKLLFGLYFKSLFKVKDTQFRCGGRRFLFLVAFPVLFIYGIIASRFHFFLDYIFFRGFNKQKIRTPLFIVGNFRSGTTFLYRLLAKDTQNFTCFKTWEIYLAPSISQRKFFRGILIVDRLFGGFLTRLLHKIERNMLSPIKLHQMGLNMPEEDEGILLYVWNSLWIWFMFPVFDELEKYFNFDEKMPSWQKKAIMKFYRRCVQRHLYAHGGNKIFLSKNPSFTPRIDTILKYFPDAKIINMTRNPIEMIPSNLSWFACCWSWFNDLKEPYPFKKEVMEMCRYWYLYPLKRLASEPKTGYKIISYKDITAQPEKVVKDFYSQFGFPLNKKFAQILKMEAERARSFNKTKVSSFSELGLTPKQIVKEFGEIFTYFGFDKTKE